MSGSRVHFIGTGNAFNHDGRGNQSIWIDPGGAEPFLVDVGPTTASGMELQTLNPARLSALFITHLHGDHTAGWPFLLLRLTLLEARSAPLDVVGPPGTQAHLEDLARLCYGELLSDPPFPIRFRELPVEAADGIEWAGRLLDTLPMQHHPTSIGYRFRLDDRKIGVSGDTAWCDGLERLADGCDWLVLECTTVEENDLPHVSLETLRARRDRLQAARVLLVHLPDAVAESLARDPIPGVITTHDGLVYSG